MGNVASESLSRTAGRDTRSSPHAPVHSANVNDPGDISDVDLRWNDLGMADRLLEKGVLIVQPV